MHNGEISTPPQEEIHKFLFKNLLNLQELAILQPFVEQNSKVEKLQ